MNNLGRECCFGGNVVLAGILYFFVKTGRNCEKLVTQKMIVLSIFFIISFLCGKDCC